MKLFFFFVCVWNTVYGLESSLIPVIAIAVGVGAPLLIVLLAILFLAVYLRNLYAEKRRMMGSVNNSKVEIPHSATGPTNGSSTPEQRSRPISARVPAKNKIEQWLIDYKEIQFDREVGRGASGVVSYAIWRMQHCAVKQLLATATEKDIQDFNSEAELLMNLRPHTNVVSFYGLCKDPLCIVTEFLPGGSLSSYLRSDASIDLDQVLTWAVETAAGMSHLHDEGVVHRDLASRNLLLDKNLSVKITDFGMSRIISNQEGAADVTKSDVGPLKWMAPECILEKKYSQKSDSYAFGITLIEMLTRQEPYPGQSAVNIAIGVTRDNLRPPIPDYAPTQLADLVKKCYERNADDRPTFKMIYDELYQLVTSLEQEAVP